jgi:hypothetical protein
MVSVLARVRCIKVSGSLLRMIGGMALPAARLRAARESVADRQFADGPTFHAATDGSALSRDFRSGGNKRHDCHEVEGAP